VLSNELVSPKLLFCPADSRRAPATNFTQVCLECAGLHISYAGNLKLLPEDAGKPTAILAADDNLRPPRWSCYEVGAATLDSANKFEWTGTRHRFKGDMLFADGHVEFLNNGPQLVAAISQSQSASKLGRSALAKVANPPPGLRGLGPDSERISTAAGGRLVRQPKTNQPTASSAPQKPAPAVNAQTYSPQAKSQAGAEPMPAKSPAPKVAVNLPAPSTSEVPKDEIALGTFDARVVELAPRVMARSYLLLWLLLLLYLAYTIWRRVNGRRKRRAL
jgi:prepilin-type processing-associated H-X9-DG protein